VTRQPGRDKSKLLGDCNALALSSGKHRIDEIVVGVRDRRNGHFPMSKLLECKLEGTGIVDCRPSSTGDRLRSAEFIERELDGLFRGILQDQFSGILEACISISV